MHRVLLLGAGKIGRMISRFLTDAGDYQLSVGDMDTKALSAIEKATGAKTIQVDATDVQSLTAAMADCDSVLSALSYRFNPMVARAAQSTNTSYFDLTEDVETTRQVMQIAEDCTDKQIFMPQCGLAPGFISIVANDLASRFDRIESVRMRVGALPQFPTDTFKYNLTWSTDGLINEYCNPCEAIHDTRRVELLPLEGLEQFSLDGDRYEAFNTSGGLGTLCDSLDGKVRELNYKTIRYVGHRDLVNFLVNDLRLGQRRDLLLEILENAIPITYQDVVVTFVNVIGHRQGRLVQLSDARKTYCQNIGGEIWSAIQITTAAGICTVLDMHAQGKLPSSGFVRQEQVDFNEFLANRFGKYYATGTVAAGDDVLGTMEPRA